MRTRVLVAVGSALGLLSVGGAPAGAAVLVDQVPVGTFTVPTVPSFDYPNPSSKSQGADDFTVGEGQVWTPVSIDVTGLAQAGSNGTDTGNVFLYDNAGGLPGAQLFSQSAIGLTNGGACTVGNPCNFTAPIANAPKLVPGTYWISVQGAGPYAWWWALTPPSGPFGSAAAWQNPGNAFGRDCPTYKTVIDCGWTTAESGQDFIYRLNGTITDSRFSVGGFESEGQRIFVNATFPAAGQLVIKDAGGASGRPASAKRAKKNVKKSKHTIGSSGAKKLRVKLTKSAKAKLNDGKKVKLKVKATFTATGGVAYSQTAKVKLIPVRAVAAGAAGFRLAR